MRAALRAIVGTIVGMAAVMSHAVVWASDLTVFAAASTGTAMSEIATSWEAETGQRIVLSLAGTSALARQIEAGAPADILLSASADWMDHLEARGILTPGSRRALLGNSLVVVGPHGAPELELTPGALSERVGNGRLAVALVDAVPAGIYAKAALQSLGLWDGVAHRVAQADNVRAALALVAIGAAPLGIVYASDAGAEPRVSIVARIPTESHPEIIYPVAAISDGKAGAVRAFLEYLQSHDAREAFARHGFRVLGAE